MAAALNRSTLGLGHEEWRQDSKIRLAAVKIEDAVKAEDAELELGEWARRWEILTSCLMSFASLARSRRFWILLARGLNTGSTSPNGTTCVSLLPVRAQGTSTNGGRVDLWWNHMVF